LGPSCQVFTVSGDHSLLGHQKEKDKEENENDDEMEMEKKRKMMIINTNTIGFQYLGSWIHRYIHRFFHHASAT